MKTKSISNLEMPNFGQYDSQHVLTLKIFTILFYPFSLLSLSLPSDFAFAFSIGFDL